MTKKVPPPGWYADGTGVERWWDGSEWSADETHPIEPEKEYLGRHDSGDAMETNPAADLIAGVPRPVALAVGAVVALIVVILIATNGGGDATSPSNNGPAPSRADVGNEGTARIMCEKFVKDRLKSPGSAKFSATNSSDAYAPHYVVSGAVDSENSFGALIRNNYSCTVDYAGNSKWTLEEVTGLGN